VQTAQQDSFLVEAREFFLYTPKILSRGGVWMEMDGTPTRVAVLREGKMYTLRGAFQEKYPPMHFLQ
jgi:hypothetical protein